MWAIFFGSAMAFVDIITFGILKAINLGWVSKALMILPTLLYAVQPWIFSAALNYEGIAIMNLIWNLLSSVFVTIEGVLLFNEKISNIKMVGIVFSFISIYLMSI